MKNKWQQHSIRFFTPFYGQTESKGQTHTNSRPGQYITHAHSHITWAVAAMDNCFALTGTHQHGIAVGPVNGQSRISLAALPDDVVVRKGEELARPWLAVFVSLAISSS